VPLKYRRLEQILRAQGIRVENRRGGTSHKLFIKDGPPRITYPWAWHGDNEDIPNHWIRALCRRFDLNPDLFSDN
jgi:hypothetical protein